VRLFLAVDVDEQARAALAKEQDRLRSLSQEGSPIRWVRSEHLHMTLVFLGEVEQARVDDVIAAIGRPVDRPPIALTFAGLGVFPPHGGPRALWIGLTAGEAPLRELQQTMADRVAALSIPLERRPFTPHLTLGRWKMSRPSDRSRLVQAFHDRVVARTLVDRATLYASRLSSAGPTYTELARATLCG
jgi:RNA 2',3'-cyclic 3'-phosphodiesterase